MLTLKALQTVLPPKAKVKAKQELVDRVNLLVSDPEMRERYRENLLTYTSVLQDPRFTLEQYIDAVRYCSFKFAGSTNIDAYMKTFPDRYEKHIENGTSPKDIASYVTSYSKTILVSKIMEQAMIPNYIINQEYFQEALMTQVNIMRDEDVSPKVRSDAANSVMTHLKQPETNKLEIDVTQKESSVISDLRKTMVELRDAQKELLNNGGSAKQLAESRLFNSSGEDITDVN